ncbi:MAG: cupredoxin domain-containing protein [Chloroflexi bacterium]|nr:cupredoxin domain-containing protein [Chloroflexota bacterium]
MQVWKVWSGAAVVTVALGLSIMLGACASSEGGAAPTPRVGPSPSAGGGGSSPSRAVEGGEIQVTIKNNTFPDEIRVKAGAKVVFVVTNRGDETHSFEFPDLGVYKEIDSGKTARIEWTVPDKKGKWDMGCFLTDPPGVHDRMEGTLIIE